MKVIDLLNKIANNEEVPEEIKYNNMDYYWCNNCKIYERIEDQRKDLYNDLDNLNDEVEIIGEKQISKELYNLRKSLEKEFKDIEHTWKIDLKAKEMPPIYYKYEGQIEIIDFIIKEIL